MRKLIIALALAAVASLALAAGPASAGKKTHYQVTVSMHFQRGSNFDAFAGTVRSKKGKCFKHRTVKVFKKRSGNDQKIGSDESDRHGDWQLKIPYPGASQGTYYAKVSKHKHHNYVCDKARSGVTLVPARP